MQRILFVVGLASLLTLTSCGQKSPASSSPAAEEECPSGACTEQGLNAPVGEQPVAEPHLPYDQAQGNPARNTLRFPAFDARWGLTKRIFDKAAAYFEAHKAVIANPRYFVVVDFNLRSSQKRMFVFDLSNDTVEKHAAAAGKNSDPAASGLATKFSNVSGSKMSSLGFYRTLSTYIGGHGLSLQLDGLSDTNSNAKDRAIVLHSATYVSDATPSAGRSWGCPAVDPKVSADLIAKVKNGAILLIDR